MGQPIGNTRVLVSGLSTRIILVCSSSRVASFQMVAPSMGYLSPLPCPRVFALPYVGDMDRDGDRDGDRDRIRQE